MLLPADMRDWLADGHLAWFLLDAVAEMSIGPFFASYREDGHGRAAHDPEMMVSLLLYAYAVGERSSRKIEKRCAEDVAFRVIAANRRPTTPRSRAFEPATKRRSPNSSPRSSLSAPKAGLVTVGTVALDGTRIEANAADRRNRTYEQLARDILDEAEAVDAEEDERYGVKRGDELPGHRQSRRQRLRDAKCRLDEEHEAKLAEMAAWKVAMAEHTARTGYVKKNNPPKPPPLPAKESRRVNVSDPDSRPVKTRHGFIQGYTAQATATED